MKSETLTSAQQPADQVVHELRLMRAAMEKVEKRTGEIAASRIVTHPQTAIAMGFLGGVILTVICGFVLGLTVQAGLLAALLEALR